MNKVFVFMLIASALFAQNISVVSSEKLTEAAEGRFYHPAASPSGSMVLLTSDGFTGLWLLDLRTGNISQLNNHTGAGYNPVFTADEQNIIFRKDDYTQKIKYSSIISQSLSSLSETVIEPNGRNISEAVILPDGAGAFTKDDILRSTNASNSVSSSARSYPVVFIENGAMAVYSGGSKKLLKPLGEGNYIWPSVSPDGTKLLFTAAGKGTFVSDLNGNIISNLGYANAPKFSPDGKYVVYMNDKDDGHRLTASDIYVIKADGTGRTQITSGGQMEIYPAWLGTNKIIYGTAEGIIYSTELKFE